jgi:N-acetylglutamate synthase-like GNAT family acetyltransferase
MKTLILLRQNILEKYIHKIMISVKNKKLCNGISKEYAMSSLQQDDMLILLMCPKNRNVYGFATIELKMPELHIELMGTNKSKKMGLYGIGRELIRIIVEYAKTNLFEKICLKSINQSVEFYEKMGFTYDDIVSEQDIHFNDIQENIYVIMYMIL